MAVDINWKAIRPSLRNLWWYGVAALRFLQGGAGAVHRSAQDKMREAAVSPEDFGAVGDGSTNDTTAFQNAAAKIVADGGGTLRLGAGKTYIVGRQTFAGATGLQYAYGDEDIIKINGCTKPVIIEGNGAKIKLASGLKFGSFNPTTGASHTPGALPFTDYDYQARVGEMIEVQNNYSVVIQDLELDGNLQNLSLGGQWGDTGYQCSGYGIFSYGNNSLEIRNVYAHHHALDGLAIGYANLTASSGRYPHTLINVQSEYNARQGCSWTGGNSLTVINCKFNKTGQSTFSSSPTAGFDIEAESGAYCQNGVFINCEFIDNVSNGMVADSGTSVNMLFKKCTFIGADGPSLWVSKEGYVFEDCKIYGAFGQLWGSTDPNSQTKFVRCYISDEIIDGYTPYLSGGLLNPVLLAAPVRYENCKFRTNRSKLGRLDYGIISDSSWRHEAGTEASISDQDWVVQLGATQIHNFTIDSNITNAPANAYYIAFSGTEYISGVNKLSNLGAGVVRWSNWSVGSAGYAGYFGESNSGGSVKIPSLCLELGIDARRDAYNGTQRIYSANGSVPAGVVVVQGDIFLNAACAAGGIPGWTVTTGGTTGTTAVTKAWAAVAP